MTRVLRAIGVTAALLVVCSLLGAGSAGATGRSTARAADPALTGAPAVGACYDLTMKQAWGWDAGEAPSSCRSRHTLKVLAIGMLPASLDYATMDKDHAPETFYRQVGKVCGPAVTKTLGTPLALSKTLWQRFMFAPSDAEVAAGARWFSCSVGLMTTDRLLPIPAGQPRHLRSKIPNSVAECVRSAKGGFRDVACTSPHQWRTSYAVVVHKRLTDKSAAAAGSRICSKRAGRDSLYGTERLSDRSFILTCSRKTRH